MGHAAKLFTVTFGAYLLGSVPFGLLVARWVRGVDIRASGSGNIGATNVGRVLGVRWGLVVFFLDLLKGWLSVAAAAKLAPQHLHAQSLAAFGAVVGHVCSVFLRGRGGKGVATAAGAFLFLTPVSVATALLAWLVVLALLRTVGVASIAAALVFLATQFLGDREEPTVPVVCVGVALLALLRHQSNLRKWLARPPPSSEPPTSGK